MIRKEWKWNTFSTPGGRLFLLSVLLFLLLAGAAATQLLTKWMEWNGLEEHVEVAEKRLANLQKMEGINRLDSEELKLLLERLPVNPERADFLRALRKAMDQSGVIFLTLSENEAGKTQNISKGTKKDNGEPFHTLTYALAVSGSYANISSFLSQLHSMPRLIHISDLSIQTEHLSAETATATGAAQQGFNGNAQYVLHVELAAFYLPEEQ